MIKQRKRLFKNKLIQELNQAVENDPHTLWKLLKKIKNIDQDVSIHQHNINPDKWVMHLEKNVRKGT
jgi:hypothetical protein